MGLIVASLLWDANEQSHDFSLAYDETWAIKLFNQFDRHLTVPHRNVLFTDRPRQLRPGIEQIVQPDLGVNGYGDCIRPYQLNEPMILVGLDTLIIGNIDKQARWCLENPGKLALPKHPFNDLSINGVALWGGHDRRLFDDWRGENDMDWVRGFEHQRIEALWPDRVCSWRAHCLRGVPPKGTRIIYFHGRKKFPALLREPVIRDHWR
jgi:hypothetical protein